MWGVLFSLYEVAVSFCQEWGGSDQIKKPHFRWRKRGGEERGAVRQACVEACEVAARRLSAESQRVMSMSFGQASLQLKMV